VNARFSHANVACANGRTRSPALKRRGSEEGTGRDACVRVSVADAEHAASREVVARGRAFETGSGEGNTHVLPARIVSCVVRDIPDAARSLGAHRALLWRRDWTRCRGQSVGTQLFSSRAHGRHVQSAFCAICARKSASRVSQKQTFFFLVCQVRADRLARLSGATMSTQGDGDHPMDGSTHDATESVGGACSVRRRCLTPAPRAPCRRSNARFVQKSLFVSVTRGSLDLGTPSNP
jgi:hypothetical protein